MNLRAQPLPLIANKDCDVDVWVLYDGVALTVSDKDGHISAGIWLTRDQWDSIVSAMRPRLPVF